MLVRAQLAGQCWEPQPKAGREALGPRPLVEETDRVKAHHQARARKRPREFTGSQVPQLLEVDERDHHTVVAPSQLTSDLERHGDARGVVVGADAAADGVEVSHEQDVAGLVARMTRWSREQVDALEVGHPPHGQGRDRVPGVREPQRRPRAEDPLLRGPTGLLELLAAVRPGGLEAAGHVAVPRRRAERVDVASEPHFACHEQLVSSPS